MFKELKALAGLMGQLPRLKEEMGKFQQKLGQITAEGNAGAGMVAARVNGRMEVLAVQLADEAIRMADKELLEDLIRSAINQALEKARQQVAEETGKMASGLGLPPGMELPGL